MATEKAAEEEVYFCNDDNSVKIKAMHMGFPASVIKDALENYTWRDEDFLLAAFVKNGTHFVWEIMMMLVRGSSEYISQSQGHALLDLYPVNKVDEQIPSPRVLNTHYRLDVLPSQFRGRKTVIVLRNPKDTCVSFFYHMKNMIKEFLAKGGNKVGSFDPKMADMTFSDFAKRFIMHNDKMEYGGWFNYAAYMWSLKDDANTHVIFFEDMKRNPVEEIQRLNEFMGTYRSPELIQTIADATSFSKMKEGKVSSEMKIRKDVFQRDQAEVEAVKTDKQRWTIYRKGEVGDWKNHFTVADNEFFDKFLSEWVGGKDIPFIYE